MSDDIVGGPVRVLHTLASALDAAPDPNAPIPGLTWTVTDLGRHLLSGSRMYDAMISDHLPGWADLSNGPAENQRVMDEYAPEHDLHEIAQGLHEVTDAIAGKWAGVDPATIVPWHAGIDLPMRSVAGLILSDATVHSVDLGRATHRPYEIPASDAIMCFSSLLPIAPSFVDPSAAAFVGTFDITLRGGPRFAFGFDRGTLTVTDGKAERAVCRINADPAALLLVTYGRVPAWKTALAGKVAAYGRKPWLAFKLPGFIRDP